MANYNKVILVGNLTREPQMSYLPSQTPVCEIGLAINRQWRGQDGQQREETCFVDCRCYGRQAEILNQYMSKGRPLLVEGRLQLDTWEGKDGTRRSKHRVIIERFQFLGGAAEGGGPPRRGPQQQREPQQGYGEQQQYGRRGGGSDDEPPMPDEAPDTGDDIPF